jgi:hypothetical protein
MILQEGDILICRGTRVLSKAISKATGSEASHTAVITKSNGATCVFDAQRWGCHEMLIENWLHKWDYDFIVFRPHKVPENFAERVNAYKGIKYDIRLLFLGFLRKLVGKKSVKTLFNGNGRFVCSELTMRVNTDVTNPENFAPRDVFEYCKRLEFAPTVKRGSWKGYEGVLNY